MGRKVIAEDPSFGCNFSTGISVLFRALATLRSGSMECASRQLKSGCLPGTQHQPNPGCIRLIQSALQDVVSCTRHVSHVCVRQTHEKTPLSLSPSRISVALKEFCACCFVEAGPWKLCTATCGRVLSPAGHHTSIPAGTPVW